MAKRNEEEIRKAVRKSYAKVATSGCGCGPSCGSVDEKATGKGMGYSDAELGAVPEGANMGLGCGNPTAIASLKKGETVLDLGAGGGFDCFLAADKVGKTGRVIGVDMTPEMIDKARENAKKGGYGNVEFRLGEIEHLPAADGSVDVVISNCVVNLVPDKRAVFAEAFRVLKPGGRVMISDIVLLKDLPKGVADSMAAYVSCVSGAVKKDEYLGIMKKAGFRDVKVTKEMTYPVEIVSDMPKADKAKGEVGVTRDVAERIVASIASIEVYAVKPRKA